MRQMQAGVVLQPVDRPAAFAERVARIAALGYDRLWLTDSSLHTFSPWPYLALAAQAAPALALGTAVTNPVTRHPGIVAVEAATAAEVTGGRFTLGIGAGDRPLRALARRPATVDAVEQAVAVVRRLLAGETVDRAAGELADDFADAALRHPPAHEVPVFISASGPRTLEMAGRVADGVILLCGLDPVAIEWALERVDGGARAAGRPRPHVALFAYGAVDDDEGAAMAAARSIAAWFPQTAPVYCDLLGLDPAVVERVRASYSGGEFQEAGAAASAIPDAFVAKVALCEGRAVTVDGFAAAWRAAGVRA